MASVRPTAQSGRESEVASRKSANIEADVERYAGVMSGSNSEDGSGSDSDSDVGENSQDYRAIVLGFAEKIAPDEDIAEVFAPSRFPSKLGGLPVWLYGDHAPPAQHCNVCGAVLAFLLQLYAPVDIDAGAAGVDGGHAFHRMLYVFVCREDGCAGGNGSAKVLSATLPRRNNFYGYDAAIESGDDGDAGEQTSATAALPRKMRGCELCGFAAPTRCGQCSVVAYCSRQCQRTDWCHCGHREACGVEERNPDNMLKRVTWRFEEHEIIHGQCPNPGIGSNDTESDEHGVRVDAGKTKTDSARGVVGLQSDENANARISMGIKDMADAMKSGTLQNVDSSEMPNSLFHTGRDGKSRRKRDRAFARFSDAMRLAPDQVVRYWRGGRPLWASADDVPDATTAPGLCGRCGSARLFEFQVVAQAIWYVGKAGLAGGLRSGAGGLDFGTVAVFSCSRACASGMRSGNEYTEEFAWVQKISAAGDC
jgi:pre-rRNA-processing protein TSR4